MPELARKRADGAIDRSTTRDIPLDPLAADGRSSVRNLRHIPVHMGTKPQRYFPWDRSDRRFVEWMEQYDCTPGNIALGPGLRHALSSRCSRRGWGRHECFIGFEPASFGPMPRDDRQTKKPIRNLKRLDGRRNSSCERSRRSSECLLAN
jgi:hypothetical protein